ncbi:radical SAM protein [Haematospirillum sp. H1815]|uniref:B12-binding domain-containing radical SAM protein n=1 Tax=Haematospirillum sp. H1815 TaxID=2723108 RepID=UPI001439C2C3|nr:radical SAM protein [Haematospirillum sp. H1815]NKD76843.1 radical SAM protein [Haematospirillum sp. H1815]
MRVLFVNPPVIRSEKSSAENDFKLDGVPLYPWLRKIPGIRFLWRRLGIGRGIRYGVRAGSRWPWTMDVPHGGPHYPFFMGYAASLVAADGHQVNIIDAVSDEEYSYERFLKRVSDWKPDLIVQECSTPTVDIDLWMARKLAKIADLAVAGPHFTENEIVSQVQRDYPEIKYILRGEYIYGAQKLVRELRPGVYEGQVVTDLDTIPFPFRDYPAALNYYDPSMPTARPQLQIYGSKGCPFKCTFCVWPQAMFQKKVSLRDPERIAAEIREAVALYGYRSIFFDDDTFNMGTERISRLCDLLKEIGLPWTMMGRLDISPDWLYEKMVDSGCVGMRFGIETFDLQVLARVKKGIERKDFRGTLERLCTKYPNLMLHITMMRDMPGQSEEAHQLDMEIIHGLGFTVDNMRRSYQLSHCSPFPGTEMYKELKAGDAEAVLHDFRKYDGGQETVMKTINGG